MGKLILMVVGFILGAAAGAGGISFLRTKGTDLAVKVFPVLANPAAAATETTPDGKPVAPGAGKKGEGSSAKELELRRMIVEVKTLREQLAQKEKDVQAREIQQRQDKEQLENTRKQIDTIMAQMNADAVQKDEVDMKNSKRLAKLWSSMEPAEVYRIVKDLDPAMSARIMYAMSERSAAPILGFMALLKDPEAAKLAADLTKRLKAMRISNVTTAATNGTPAEAPKE
jgi:flagellar motility protein MotE (MotC chaperone)